jgi:type II secretory pathway pseudopilin PulG
MNFRNLQKGAMFGLDARIALAIFGALSVISGAALYSAIQHAKVIQLNQEFLEIEKAIEAYIIDTGSNLPIESSNADVDELFTSTNTSWKGPYLTGKADSSADGDGYRSYPNSISSISNLFIKFSYASSLNSCYLTLDNDCRYRIMLNNIPTILAKNLDEFVDGSIDENAGKVTYTLHASVYYLSIPVLK